MKLYLGIELSISKTIVYAYNPDSRIEELIYNQPSIAILPNGDQNRYFFGDECFKNEIVGHYTFKSMYFVDNPSDIKAYIKHLFEIIKEKMHDDLDIRYIVVNRYPNSNTLNEVFNGLIAENKEFKNIKLLFNDSIKLLNINLTSLLFDKKIDSSNILTFNLDDHSYDYSIYFYDGLTNIPQTDKLLSSISFDKSTSSGVFSDIGLYSFLYEMIKSAIERKKLNIQLKLIDFERNQASLSSSQFFYKLIYELSKKISNGVLAYFSDTKIFSLTIDYEYNGKSYSMDVTYEDYNKALENVIYSKKGLRRSLLNVKKELDSKNIGYKLIPYGSFYSIIEVKALVDQIFGRDNILTLKELNNKDMMEYNSYLNIAYGAIESTKLTYEGSIPSISFVNYNGDKIEVMNDYSITKEKTELLLSTTISGMPFYALNKEFEIPLFVQVNADYLEKNHAKINIGQIDNSNKVTTIDLYSHIYNNENYRLISLNNIISDRDLIIAKLTIGLIKNNRNNPSIVLNLYNDNNKYRNEIILEMEEL